MKILYLTHGVFDKGGISRYCRYQITALREYVGENNVEVISLCGPGCYPYEFEDKFEVFWGGKGFSSLEKIKFVKIMIKEILRWRPDIIICSHINICWLSWLISKIYHVKKITNVYGLEVWSGLTRIKKKGLLGQDMVIADCYNTADYVRENLNYTKMIKVIWDPVDITRFFPRRRDLDLMARYNIPYSPSYRYVMTICRLTKSAPHKGIDRIIEIFGRFIKEPYIYYIVGGDGDDKPRLMELAKKYEVDKRVIFLGSIPEKDLAGVYNICDIFVMVTDKGPGRGEGIPMTPMEAAACGKPIIVGNQDGSKEIINNGEGGFVLPPFNLEVIANAIKYLLENDEIREKMGNIALKRIRENFSYEAFCRRIQEAIESVQ